MPQTVSAQALPNQLLQCQVSAQAATLHIYQTAYGLFMDIYLGPDIVIAGVICQNLNRIVRNSYLGFVGDFCWLDTEGTSDPIYTGIGTRFLLFYFSEADLAAQGVAD